MTEDVYSTVLSNGASEVYSNGASEVYSNSPSEVYSNGASEAYSNGASEVCAPSYTCTYQSRTPALCCVYVM